jgi:hypothetical protein
LPFYLPTQVQSNDRSREDNNGGGNCDRISYPDPDICIRPYPPDLNCPDVPYKNFQVTGRDPHGFDRDDDGIGCESADGDDDDNGNGNDTKPLPTIEPIPNPCDSDDPPSGCPEPEPPICTPDGPECPPCPEGVEAGWCADEDERGDFDCGDEGMENDPRCKDGEPVNGSEEEIEPEVIEEELPDEEEEDETGPIVVEEEPIEEESEPNTEVEEG